MKSAVMDELEEPAAPLRQKSELLRASLRRSSEPKLGALLILLLIQVLTMACRAQLANDADKCEKNVNSNPDLALQGCTAVIASGQLVRRGPRQSS